jgi:hypothetical protein
MKKYIKFLLLISALLCSLSVYSQSYKRDAAVIDTPTAYTLDRGMYEFSFLAYDNGGVELKAYIGLHDNLFLGVSVDVENALGKDEARPNVPGVIAKLKITDGWETFPISFAIGYDSFYMGQVGKTENYENELNRMIYGPYIVVTKPIYLLYDEQHIHFGVRVPAQPYYVPEDASYFLSLDIPVGEFVIFKAESERVYYNFERHDDWLLSFGLKYSYFNHIGVEIDVMLQKHERANRLLRIEYTDEF